MITISLKIKGYEGSIEILYDSDTKLLKNVSYGIALDAHQIQFINNKLIAEFESYGQIKSYFERLNDKFVATVLHKEISFDDFWNKYDDKTNSSKKRTEAKWNKMPVAERARAYGYIEYYFINIPRGTRKKYAETYLNDELWNN